MPDKLIIRKAVLNDLQAMTDIYNDAILNSVATFDTEPKTNEEQQEWFLQHGGRYPLLVAEINGVVVGWVSLSEWSGRCAYADTVELSIYVHQAYRRKGIGKQMLAGVIEEARRKQLHSIIARIESSNEIIIRMCGVQGFTHIGIMKEVGRKFNRLLDVAIMQKIL